jgi:mRNA-degrading endonuclease RelE of RelBE toxin-antitoxin system
MSWTVRIGEDAQAFIQGLPTNTRRLISRSISDLEQDPFRGDVKPLTMASSSLVFRVSRGFSHTFILTLPGAFSFGPRFLYH